MTILSFPHDLKVRFQFEHLAKPFAHNRVIFGQEDSNMFHINSKLGFSGV